VEHFLEKSDSVFWKQKKLTTTPNFCIFPTTYLTNTLQPCNPATLPQELHMNEQTIREKIRAFIVTDLIRDKNYRLKNDEGIITGGLMDSFALAEFGVFVEDEFGVYIPDSDLTVANLDTLDMMTARVLRDRN
jgi:acyl carrier protein